MCMEEFFHAIHYESAPPFYLKSNFFFKKDHIIEMSAGTNYFNL